MGKSISSVRGKSTGFSEPSVRYTDEMNGNSDANPHPNAGGPPSESVGKDCGCEYMEKPTTGIDMMGVGNQRCNDAACEQITKHPTAEDLAQAGSMRGR